jgi:hypothetical protein
MSETTKELESRIEAALEYYYTHDVSVREAADFHDFKNHTTLLYRIHNTNARPKSTNGGQNKLLTPAQEAVILAYGRSQAYAGWPCDRALVLAAVEHIRNQGRDPDDVPLPPPSKKWVKNFMRAHKDFHIIK